ncbi:DUF5316 family protein [Virgibacillus byunsanensis]|uniref:DUF5316 family protein n=1 Tax=Virgibacillus byunsanensis TaxID=570945 RepID=A0ABW3LKY6_9BACI
MSGQQVRANYHTETREDREKRTRTMLILGIIGLPHVIVGALLLLTI